MFTLCNCANIIFLLYQEGAIFVLQNNSFPHPRVNKKLLRQAFEIVLYLNYQLNICYTIKYGVDYSFYFCYHSFLHIM